VLFARLLSTECRPGQARAMHGDGRNADCASRGRRRIRLRSVTEDLLRLTLKLEGSLVRDHRLPLSELQRVAQQLRGTLRSIAVVLTDSGPSGQSGRVKKFIEESVDLRVVGAPQAGSFVLEMEAPPDAPADAPPEQVEMLESLGPQLADRSVRALLSGLDDLSEETERLPEGFDRGVLRAIDGFRQTLSRGVSDIVLALPQEPKAKNVRLDQSKLQIARGLIKRPHRSHAVVEGSLRMVDDDTLECRVDTPGLASVTCYFDQTRRDVVWDAGHGRKFVRVSGEGEFFPGESRPRRLWATSIVVTHEALPFDPDVFWANKSLQALAEDQGIERFVPRALDDPWRDDAEAEALIAAMNEE
jgi:hypothetical protein